MAPYIIIGVSGVTCSGKTTLAKSLYDYFSCAADVNSVQLLRQDDYFYKKHSPKHTWIPHLNYINREIQSSLDMDRMHSDIDNILKNECTEPGNNMLIIEGFLIWNDSRIRELCTVKMSIRIPYEVCLERRKTRIYNPPNPSGYFEEFIWPFYLKHIDEVKHLLCDGLEINGILSKKECFDLGLNFIRKCSSNLL